MEDYHMLGYNGPGTIRRAELGAPRCKGTAISLLDTTLWSWSMIMRGAMFQFCGA